MYQIHRRFNKIIVILNFFSRELYVKKDNTLFKAGEWMTNAKLAYILSNIAGKTHRELFSGQLLPYLMDDFKSESEGERMYTYIWSLSILHSYAGINESLKPGLHDQLCRPLPCRQSMAVDCRHETSHESACWANWNMSQSG